MEKRAPETILFGQPLTYEIVVRNVGAGPVYHVRVEDELPPGVRYLGGEPMAEMGQNRLGWLVGTIEPNGERRMRVDLQPHGEGEIRSNLAVGGKARKTELTDREKEICAALGPELQKRGILFAGIDVIGGKWLTEINVTSPTGIVAIDEFNGTDTPGLIWQAIERRRS